MKAFKQLGSVLAVLWIAVLLPGPAWAQSHWVAKTFQTPDEAAHSLSEFAKELRAHGDPRSMFPSVYARTISATSEHLKQGDFTNPKWVRALVVNYANLYRRTIARELSGQRGQLSLGWQLEFNYAQTAKPWSPSLDMVYGINVHIARDLVEALLITPTDFKSATVADDFTQITEVLRQTMPEIWNVYLSYGRDMGFPDFLEQSVMISWIAYLRRMAWYNAEADSTHSPAQRRADLNLLDRQGVELARQHGVLLPVSQ